MGWRRWLLLSEQVANRASTSAHCATSRLQRGVHSSGQISSRACRRTRACWERTLVRLLISRRAKSAEQLADLLILNFLEALLDLIGTAGRDHGVGGELELVALLLAEDQLAVVQEGGHLEPNGCADTTIRIWELHLALRCTCSCS
jgi:hypothetical protein